MAGNQNKEDNKIASKVNNAFDILTKSQKQPGKEDLSYDIFQALFYIIGFVFLASAVVVVFSNFGIWRWPVQED